MFMFRSKRTTLTKQLVKARKRRLLRHQNEARRSVEAPSSAAAAATANNPTTTPDGGLALLNELLKRLKENQLEMLLQAIETRGEKLSHCVLLSRDFYEPHVLCCQMWRWPDVRHGAELRRLPACRSATDPIYICCNPYHWSRLCQTETPPPPYSRCAIDSSSNFKPEDRAPSEAALVCRDSYSPGSLTTNGEDSSQNSRGWCKLAYWELTKRVGPLFPVEPLYFNVFGDIPCGDGLSLKELAQHSFSPPDSVSKTRCKIGLGVTLSREDDGIWVYNRSDNPVFVNSLTLEDADMLPSSPTRVPAEHCLCVFDPIKAATHPNYGWNYTNNLHNHNNYNSFHNNNNSNINNNNNIMMKGPIDKNSVQISFAKGWGPGYSRQEIASCPCWIEILLAPCR